MEKPIVYTLPIGNKPGIVTNHEPKYKNKSFVNDNHFKEFVQAVIYIRKEVSRARLLSLLFNYGKKLEDLNKISFLGNYESIGKIQGEIKQKGDGKRGYLGQGPIIYYFEEN
jgi:hypothetical protein